MKSVLVLSFFKINATVDFFFIYCFTFIEMEHESWLKLMSPARAAQLNMSEHVADVLITRLHRYIVNIY